MTKDEVLTLAKKGESRTFYVNATSNTGRKKSAVIGLLIVDFYDKNIYGLCESNTASSEFVGVHGTIQYEDMVAVV